jgi:hypothetical protein
MRGHEETKEQIEADPLCHRCRKLRDSAAMLAHDYQKAIQNAQEGREDAPQRPIRRGDVCGHGAGNKENSVKA